MFLRLKNYILHVKVNELPKVEQEHFLLSKPLLYKVAGKPNPKKHFKLALYYFTAAIAVFCAIMSLSGGITLKLTVLLLCFQLSVCLGIYQLDQRAKARKRKRLLEKIEERRKVELK